MAKKSGKPALKIVFHELPTNLVVKEVRWDDSPLEGQQHEREWTGESDGSLDVHVPHKLKVVTNRGDAICSFPEPISLEKDGDQMRVDVRVIEKEGVLCFGLSIPCLAVFF